MVMGQRSRGDETIKGSQGLAASLMFGVEFAPNAASRFVERDNAPGETRDQLLKPGFEFFPLPSALKQMNAFHYFRESKGRNVQGRVVPFQP